MTSACSSSTATGLVLGAAAAIATICWASTSSALRGTTVVSISPSRIRRATTAHSSRSARNFGKIRPRLTSPTEWPARPIRCSPRATDFGDSTWITRSTAPMSIPSSSERGRDQARQLAGLQHLLDDEPLLARERAVVGAGDSGPRRRALDGQLVQPQRQPLGGAAVVDEHDRRAVRLDQLEQLGVDRRPDRPARRLGRRRAGRGRACRRPASGSTIDSTGTRISRSSCLRTPVSTTRQRARRADQEAADLLERPLGRRQPDPLDLVARPPRSSRSSVSARCAPRLVAATAWISSTMHHRAPSNSSCAREVSIRYSDSGVVIRMSGGSRSIAWRSRCGVSPVRTATLQLGADPAQRRRAGCGRCRRRAPSAARRRRARCALLAAPSGARSAASWSIAHRNAASVLPEPVGAEIRTCSPEAIAGHACSCAAVGASNAP